MTGRSYSQGGGPGETRSRGRDAVCWSVVGKTREQTALVAGGTGLVGAACVRHLLGVPTFDRIVAVGRRPLSVRDARIEMRMAALDALDAVALPAVDAAFCALGTTIANAGSQEAFRRIDLDGVVAFARLAAKASARRFVLVSSVGADASSSNFYLRVKGETERDVQGLGFGAVAILRPGLLLGTRAESRPAEAVARAVAPAFNLLLVGPLAKYRAVEADRVAAAMIAAAAEPRSGTFVIDVPEIERLAAQG